MKKGEGRGLDAGQFDLEIEKNILPAPADNRAFEVNYQNIMPIIDFNLL